MDKPIDYADLINELCTKHKLNSDQRIQAKYKAAEAFLNGESIEKAIIDYKTKCQHTR